MKRTQTRHNSHRLLCLLMTLALFCTSFAAFNFRGKLLQSSAEEELDLRPVAQPAVTTKGSNRLNDANSQMTADNGQNGGVQSEPSYWPGPSCGWGIWPDPTPVITVERVTGINDFSGRSNASAAKVTYGASATANQANSNFIVHEDSASFKRITGRDPKRLYFSAWFKVEQTTWFDITIDDAGYQQPNTKLYDLGRRFKVEPGAWVEVGKDDSGNYLPFRTLGPSTGGGTRSNVTSLASSATDETKGSVEYYMASRTNIKIYAHTTATGNVTANGLSNGNSYQFTEVFIWEENLEVPIKVGALNMRSRAFLVANDQSTYHTTDLTKNAAGATITDMFSPAGATDKRLTWASSDTNIATVDANGLVTAVAPGDCTITASAVFSDNVTKEIAVTVYDDEKNIAMTPDDLEPITQIARNRLPGANFTSDDFPIVGREYGVGWTFAYGTLSTNATWVGVTDDTIPSAGVSSAIRITNKGGTNSQNDALTYSYLHGAVGNNEDVVNEVIEEGKIFYFSSMVKVSKPTWFSVTIGYSPACALGNHYEGTPYYDLGRKFLVTPEMGWTEIGKADGAYLPFRSNGQNSSDAAPSASNSFASATGDNYANESKGNVLFNLPGAPSTNDLNYGFIRISAYGADALASEDGSGVASGSGFVDGDSYDLTAVRFWSYDSIPPEVIKDVESVTLNKTTTTLAVGAKETLVATVSPADASYPDVYWTSSNPAIASVNALTGEVTAVAVGTATITAEADGKSATCAVTVTAAAAAVNKTALQTKYDAVKDIAKGNYTDATWDVFDAARTAAKGVLDNASATQNEVDLALTALNTAHEGLATSGSTPNGCNSGAAAALALLLPLGFIVMAKKRAG